MDLDMATIVALGLTVLYAAVLIYLIRRRQGQLDERQLAVQARAFRTAALIVIGVYLVSVIGSGLFPDGYRYGFICFSGAVVLGAAVFFIMVILGDAYIVPSDLERRLPFFRLGVLITLNWLWQASRAVVGIARGELTLQKDPGSDLWFYLMAAAAAVAVYICFFVKLHLMKKEMEQ